MAARAWPSSAVERARAQSLALQCLQTLSQRRPATMRTVVEFNGPGNNGSEVRDGVAYEIDLSSGNADELRGELTQYVEHARKSGSAQVRRRRQRNGAGREQSARIREWARSHGHKVNERGRIPANIVAEYEAAH